MSLGLLLLGLAQPLPSLAQTPLASGSGQVASSQIASSQVFALAPILTEMGEPRTRQWLHSLNRQCRASKAKNIDALCRAQAILTPATAWEEVKKTLDQVLSLKCASKGFMTAYYEPVLQGSLDKESDQQVALYALPEAAARAVYAKQTWFSRGEIENLSGEGSSSSASNLLPDLVPIAWIDDPVEAFFLHIQGSGRIQLRDRSAPPILRVGFAGHNGHNYVAIGSTLVGLGEMQRAEVSANSIKAWLRLHLDGTSEQRQKAFAVLHSNPRYVFFKRMPEAALAGPLGALGVPLTDMASVAADPAYHPLGSGLLIFTERLGAQLVQVQDVGGGIKGPGRLDLFTGTGDAAGALASDFKEPLKSLELVAKVLPEGPKPARQLDIASTLENCSGGM